MSEYFGVIFFLARHCLLKCILAQHFNTLVLMSSYWLTELAWPAINYFLILSFLPMKMEPTESFETSAF